MNHVSQKFQLVSGNFMPLVGIGTFRVHSQHIFNVLDEALKAGYRSIDTAAVYRNEDAIGAALKILLPKYNLKREDIFITTKLDPVENGNPEGVRRAVRNSLMALQTDYVDLYLIHWPGAGRIHANSSLNTELRTLTWKTLVELHQQGCLKSIGVSNYNINHLQQLFKNSDGVRPSVNQVECHPHYRQDELLKFCTEEGIHLQAYSSLGGSDNGALLNDSTVRKISSNLNVSPARLLLKWALQRGIGIIPKAQSANHIQDNLKLDFTIDQESMKLLSNLPERKYAWDPSSVN
ncbi:aldo-keto reductase family 4 member C8-like [Leptopilina heterotoma]|uniref:aldo-keto reductase family 4 member C8-like n=1 Tax=Leptopilina heterotoma TaxID=63436 RepID=UPI001CAA1BA8|nr:aldo-keto reductase family 4 member C8-like [Leptopilina heterotoma]